jgi:hypothetical protein
LAITAKAQTPARSAVRIGMDGLLHLQARDDPPFFCVVSSKRYSAMVDISKPSTTLALRG